MPVTGSDPAPAVSAHPALAPTVGPVPGPADVAGRWSLEDIQRGQELGKDAGRPAVLVGDEVYNNAIARRKSLDEASRAAFTAANIAGQAYLRPHGRVHHINGPFHTFAHGLLATNEIVWDLFLDVIVSA